MELTASFLLQGSLDSSDDFASYLEENEDEGMYKVSFSAFDNQTKAHGKSACIAINFCKQDCDGFMLYMDREHIEQLVSFAKVALKHF